VLLLCEHASRAIPKAYLNLGLPAEVTHSHWAYDRGASNILEPLAAALSAPAIAGRWSRLLVDLNRGPDEKSWARERVAEHSVPLNRDLPAWERARRQELHDAYHDAADDLAAEVSRRQEGQFLILSIHSFTPRMGGEVRVFDLGILYNDHEPLALTLAEQLARRGWKVRANEPYSGRDGLIYSPERHGDRWGVPAIEVEINQGLLTNAATRKRLVRSLNSAVRAICEPNSDTAVTVRGLLHRDP
jgi:predicted N-formylglutamate amidohydrolase